MRESSEASGFGTSSLVFGAMAAMLVLAGGIVLATGYLGVFGFYPTLLRLGLILGMLLGGLGLALGCTAANRPVESRRLAIAGVATNTILVLLAAVLMVVSMF